MPKVQHIVLLRFKPGTPVDTGQRVFAGLASLKIVIPGMLSVAGGTYESPEGLSQGFTHGCVITFADVAARDRYLAHPAHEKVKEEFLPAVENVIAFDFVER